MPNWLLPENIADVLPSEARKIEELRRLMLDNFRLYGYELVMPPLLEYLESLLTGAGEDTDLRTFKLVDQLSGRMLGLRADMTTQVARIDAHLLNHRGVTRLCYCDSVLHTLPATISASREPVQIGAELYGYAGIAADLDVTPTKKLGQNFVVDANTVRKIVHAAAVQPGERVVEIGPGLGSLTLAILETGAAVTAGPSAATAASTPLIPGQRTTNSSPPSRATRSSSRVAARMLWATWAMTASPTS